MIIRGISIGLPLYLPKPIGMERYNGYNGGDTLIVYDFKT